MAAPALDDYQFQYKDTGIVLNGAGVLPYVDVVKVSGLDMAPVEADSVELDGVHGGVFNAQYASARIIILDCEIFSSTSSADSFADTLNSNFKPDNINWPFYFKGTGVTQRYIMAKSLGIKYDIDNLRGFGKTIGQIQLGAGDPRKYTDNSNVTMTSGTSYNITNSGNMESYPLVTVTGAWTILSLQNVTDNKTVTITSPAQRLAGDITVIDFSTRSVKINGSRVGSYVTTNSWWELSPGTKSVKVTATTGVPTSIVFSSKNAWW